MQAYRLGKMTLFSKKGPFCRRLETLLKGQKGTKNIAMAFFALIFINFTFFSWGDDFWPKCKPIGLERLHFSTKKALFVDD